MFATLASGYPRPSGGDRSEDDDDALIRLAIADQLDAGLGLLSDGSIRWPDPVRMVGDALLPAGRPTPHRSAPLTVDAWGFSQATAGAAVVKQCLPGPYTLARRFAPAGPGGSRAALALAFADELAGELADLAEAGCPFVQIDEDAAVAVGADETERRLFVDAQERLLAGLGSAADRPHASLAVVGGSADGAGLETIFGPAYDSYLFDLVAGPDNWRLAARAPLDRGLVLGVVDAAAVGHDDPALVVWAIGYAASSGRGEERIGIAPSGSLSALPREAARSKLGLLGEVVRLIERRRDEAIAASLDPRAVDARSAALGTWRSRRPDG